MSAFIRKTALAAKWIGLACLMLLASCIGPVAGWVMADVAFSEGGQNDRWWQFGDDED